MKQGVSRALRLALTALILIGLVLFARTVKWHATWAAIRDADRGVLLLAAAVNMLSLAIKGVRWWIFLRPVGAGSLWMAVKATFAGAGLNNILVANGGEAARVIFVARAAHVQSAKILATLALERMFELIGYIVLLALAVSFLELPPALERLRPLAWLALAGVTGLMIFLVRRPEEIKPRRIHMVGWFDKTRAYLRHFVDTLGGISTGPRFAAALVLSVAVWALQLWTYSLTARAAHFNLPLVGTVAAILAVNLGFAIRPASAWTRISRSAWPFSSRRSRSSRSPCSGSSWRRSSSSSERRRGARRTRVSISTRASRSQRVEKSKAARAMRAAQWRRGESNPGPRIDRPQLLRA